MVIFQKMIVLFLIMLTGYFCYKKGMFNEELKVKLSGIVVNIANPAMILTSVLKKNRVSGRDLLQTVIAAVVIYGVLLLLAIVIPRILRVEKKDSGVYRAMFVFSNIGFMGLPLLNSMYGEEALLYGSVFLIPFNILIYTYGIASMKSKGSEPEPFSLKKIFNVGVIACLIAMVIFAAKIPVPAFLAETLTQFANLAAPLSMLVIGCQLAVMDLKKLFTDVRLFLFSFIKLLILPITGVLILKNFISNEILLGVCMVVLATPVGSMTAMLAQEYGGDYELASRGVALTTLLSVITIPIAGLLL